MSDDYPRHAGVRVTLDVTEAKMGHMRHHDDTVWISVERQVFGTDQSTPGAFGAWSDTTVHLCGTVEELQEFHRRFTAELAAAIADGLPAVGEEVAVLVGPGDDAVVGTTGPGGIIEFDQGPHDLGGEA